MAVRNREQSAVGCWQLAAFLSAICLLLSACSSTRPVIKIGLVAPFVGHYREIGEEIIYAVRLAVREANESGGIAGYSIELMAYDDEGDPTLAEENARKVVTDPQVVGVIGHWLDSTSLSAAPVYAASGIPYLATTASPELDPAAYRLWYTTETYLATQPESTHCPLPCDPFINLDLLQSTIRNPKSEIFGPASFGLNLFPRLVSDSINQIQFLAPAPMPADSNDKTFADRYLAISPGPQPRYFAVLAYDATQVLLEAIKVDIEVNGLPTRSGVASALAQTNYEGLSGHFSFDLDRDWVDAQGWIYEWREGRLNHP
jgi:ABC-type branched-subunit amino acid transport system substrate-binding protein